MTWTLTAIWVHLVPTTLKTKLDVGYPHRTWCLASTTSAGTLPHPNGYSTKVVASTKMLPKTREAATWAQR